MIDELEPDQIEIALEAFKTIRDAFEDRSDDALADLNEKRIGMDKFAVREIGREFTRSDIQGVIRKRRLRRLVNQIEKLIRQRYLAGDNVREVKKALIAALSDNMINSGGRR